MTKHHFSQWILRSPANYGQLQLGAEKIPGPKKFQGQIWLRHQLFLFEVIFKEYLKRENKEIKLYLCTVQLVGVFSSHKPVPSVDSTGKKTNTNVFTILIKKILMKNANENKEQWSSG